MTPRVLILTQSHREARRIALMARLSFREWRHLYDFYQLRGLRGETIWYAADAPSMPIFEAVKRVARMRGHVMLPAYDFNKRRQVLRLAAQQQRERDNAAIAVLRGDALLGADAAGGDHSGHG